MAIITETASSQVVGDMSAPPPKLRDRPIAIGVGFEVGKLLSDCMAPVSRVPQSGEAGLFLGASIYTAESPDPHVSRAGLEKVVVRHQRLSLRARKTNCRARVDMMGMTTKPISSVQRGSYKSTNDLRWKSTFARLTIFRFWIS